MTLFKLWTIFSNMFATLCESRDMHTPWSLYLCLWICWTPLWTHHAFSYYQWTRMFCCTLDILYTILLANIHELVCLLPFVTVNCFILFICTAVNNQVCTRNSLFSDSDIIKIITTVLCMYTFTPLYTVKQNRQLTSEALWFTCKFRCMATCACCIEIWQRNIWAQCHTVFMCILLSLNPQHDWVICRSNLICEQQ